MQAFEIGGLGSFNPQIPLTIFGDFDEPITSTSEAAAKENLQTSTNEAIIA